MACTLTLTSELEQRLAQEAQRQGMSVDEYAAQLLDKNLPHETRPSSLHSTLQEWLDDGDIKEQQETVEYLYQALNEDRLSNRKLYPKELKGISW